MCLTPFQATIASVRCLAEDTVCSSELTNRSGVRSSTLDWLRFLNSSGGQLESPEDFFLHNRSAVALGSRGCHASVSLHFTHSPRFRSSSLPPGLEILVLRPSETWVIRNLAVDSLGWYSVASAEADGERPLMGGMAADSERRAGRKRDKLHWFVPD